MAELFGKVNGCSKGKGGMFSYYDPGRNHWGCHGLAAAQTPLAAGLAFAVKQREESGAVVCFLGDGAVNQGVYHESLNLAGLFGLPVVCLIENNGYSMGTSVARSSCFKECLARRAETYDIDWDRCGDGDMYELRARVWTALERARHERRPTAHAWWHRDRFLTGLAWDNLAAAALLRPAGPPASVLMLGVAAATPDDLLLLGSVYWGRLCQSGWVLDRTRLSYLSSLLPMLPCPERRDHSGPIWSTV